MEHRQEEKLRRAKKRVRNLVAKDSKHRGQAHKSVKDYARKNNKGWQYEEEIT